MTRESFVFLRSTSHEVRSLQSSELGTTWWIIVVIIVILIGGIAAVLVWQRLKGVSSPFMSRSWDSHASCQICGRERRVPPELMDHVEDFVCRECVRAAFPDLDNPQRDPDIDDPNMEESLRNSEAPPPLSLEEMQRRERLSAMRRAQSQTFKIKRMTSTFFRVRSAKDAIPVGASKSSLDLDDLANDEDDGTCKVLLPCGHGGLCQGCAKDLVLSGKPCYICGEEYHMLAELKLKSSGVIDDADDATTGKGRFIGKLIRPDSLHHSKSISANEPSPPISDSSSGSPPAVPASRMRQNTAPVGAGGVTSL